MNKPWPAAILLDFYGTVVEEIHIPVRDICERISMVSSSELNTGEFISYWVKSFTALCSQSYDNHFLRQKELEAMSLQEAFLYFHVPLDARMLSRKLSDYRGHPVLFPESRPVLAQCRIPICLVTNVDNDEIQSAVKYLDLHFDHIVTSEDCRSYKPRKEMFDKALSLVGLSAAEVLHVGDSWQGDVQGAKNLGIPVLWIDRRKRPAGDGGFKADYVASDLTGLLDILQSKKL